MSKHKYIINNCPIFGTDYSCGEGFDRCATCTDCIMKQIVELCKEESSLIQHKQKIRVKGLNKLADKIFELLDIQEVE